MLTVNSGDFIKHEKFLDVCIKVQQVVENEKGFKVLGTFWNQAYVSSFCTGQRVVVDIALNKDYVDDFRRTSVEEWEILRAENSTACLRKGSWEKLYF